MEIVSSAIGSVPVSPAWLVSRSLRRAAALGRSLCSAGQPARAAPTGRPRVPSMTSSPTWTREPAEQARVDLDVQRTVAAVDAGQRRAAGARLLLGVSGDGRLHDRDRRLSRRSAAWSTSSSHAVRERPPAVPGQRAAQQLGDRGRPGPASSRSTSAACRRPGARRVVQGLRAARAGRRRSGRTGTARPRRRRARRVRSARRNVARAAEPARSPSRRSGATRPAAAATAARRRSSAGRRAAPPSSRATSAARSSGRAPGRTARGAAPAAVEQLGDRVQLVGQRDPSASSRGRSAISGRRSLDARQRRPRLAPPSATALSRAAAHQSPARPGTARPSALPGLVVSDSPTTRPASSIAARRGRRAARRRSATLRVQLGPAGRGDPLGLGVGLRRACRRGWPAPAARASSRILAASAGPRRAAALYCSSAALASVWASSALRDAALDRLGPLGERLLELGQTNLPSTTSRRHEADRPDDDLAPGRTDRVGRRPRRRGCSGADHCVRRPYLGGGGSGPRMNGTTKPSRASASDTANPRNA